MRSIAEFIRRTVDRTSSDMEEALRARERAKGAEVPDGWLRSSLKDCDAPNILKAAVGREVLVIPMAMRCLVERRTR